MPGSLSCEEADPDSSGLEAVGSAAVEALWSPGKVVCLELDWLRSWRNTVLGSRTEVLQEPGPSGVGERIFARRRCGETAGWSLSSGTMLNTSHDRPVELM